jgi:hypothetical protein
MTYERFASYCAEMNWIKYRISQINTSG